MSTRRRAPKLLTTIVAAMLAQVAALFMREWISRVLIESGVEPGFARLQSALAGFLALLLLIGPLLFQHRHMLCPMLERPFKFGRTLIDAIAIGIAVRLVSWGIVILDPALDESAFPTQAAPPVVDAARHCTDIAYAAVFLLTLAVVTPLFEEVISRGLILGRLLTHRPRTAPPLSAALFAILHTPDDMPLAFAFGMVAAVMVCSSRSLWGAIAAHATANALLLLDPGCFAPGTVDAFVLASDATTRGIVGSLLIAVPLLVAFGLARRAGAGR